MLFDNPADRHTDRIRNSYTMGCPPVCGDIHEL